MAEEDKTSKSPDEVTLVTQNLESMNQLVTNLMQKVAALESREEAPAENKAEPPTFDPAGLEEMSREQFAKTMMGQFQAGIEQISKRFEDQIQRVQRSVQTLDASAQVKEAAREHKDFWDWRAEMKALSDKHPTMSAEELYQTARAADSSKAQELDTKYQPPQETAPSDGKGAKEGKASMFGGLAPSTVDTPEQPDNMTFDTAAEKSWQENMAGLNEVLNSG